MVDKHDRNINYLRVSVTDRCNLRCIYCMPAEGISCLRHEDILKYEELHRIIRVASEIGICKIRITGGEPLIRRGIVEFVESLRTIPKLNDISMTTNGVLLEDFAAELFNAGIGRINISLDSLNADKYRQITRHGNLQSVLAGIAKAHQVGFSPIKINIVAIKGFNDDEILDFARLTIDNPFQIRFIELMPLGDAGIQSDGRFLSNDVIKERIATIGKLEQLQRQSNGTDGPADMYRLAGSKGQIGLISAISHNFCSSCNRLRLTSDGQLRNCLLSDSETDLRGPLRSGCSDSGLGDIIERAIAKKPDRHKIAADGNYIKKCVKEMSTIGG